MKKVCTACGTEKELSEYYKSAEGRLKRFSKCKECINEENNARYSSKHSSVKEKYSTQQSFKNRLQGRKYCPGCKQIKSIEEFYKGSKSNKGVDSQCRSCVKSFYKKYKDKRREKRLQKLYNITSNQYNKLLAEQGNCCAICKVEAPYRWKSFSVDHCHQTGAVRGLLCEKCNRGLGNFDDSAKILSVALEYLLKYETNKNQPGKEAVTISDTCT